MFYLEIVSLCLSACLCIICTISDIHKGIIYNKILIVFAVAAILADSLYYGFFARNLFLDFLPNLAIISIISLYLFYSHSFAGGDCKMAIVLALLYPARYYLSFGNSIVTLVFAIAFAIIAGYVYLLIYSLKAIITKKVKFTFEYIKTFLSNFLKSYFTVMVYIVFLNSILILCDKNGFFINVWLSCCICILAAWFIGRFPIFKKTYLLVPVFVATIAVSIITRTVPVSFNLENYVLIFILLLCQMTIRTTIYENVNVNQLQKGMILSTMSSVIMQSSITKGLPGVSTEDLKSRLTQEEINSIQIWAKATQIKELTVVKKIPFAIFISIGFIVYFVLWRILV